MANFKVSVIIPAYNAEDTIVRAIESIPLDEDIEVVVVNDGSTDNTYKIVEPLYKKDVIDVLVDQPNKGVASAVNAGLDAASGEYVVLLGSDDWFVKEEFEKVKNELDGTDLVYFNLETNNGTIFRLREDTKRLYAGSVKFMRRAFIGDTRNPENKKAGEDWYFYNEILKKNPTEKFTDVTVKRYNYPREGSLSWKRGHGEFKKEEL